MRLSILIPTHNRPALFTRCLESALADISPDVEIIVNNDSNDITEIDHPQVKYHYNKFDNLSQIYQFLLNQSTGDFVYFLEDDDYLRTKLNDILDNQFGLIVGNYYPTYNTADKLVYPTIYHNKIFSPYEFLNILNREHLQLSQHIYRRDVISDFEFPMNSDIHNDILLTEHAIRRSTLIKTTSTILYCQTIDGGDNISFL